MHRRACIKEEGGWGWGVGVGGRGLKDGWINKSKPRHQGTDGLKKDG